MLEQKLPRLSKADEREAYVVVTRRDAGLCVKCLRGDVIHRDHRKNRSQGGLTTPANLQLLCLWDHKYLTEHPAEAVAEGWAVPGFAQPELWPARRWRKGWGGIVGLQWCLYDNQGGVYWITDDEATRRMNRSVA